MRRKIQLNKGEKEAIINEIKKYFKEEREEDIGDLAAMILLDYIIDNIGPIFYNQGVKDSISFLNEKIDDIYSLEIY